MAEQVSKVSGNGEIAKSATGKKGVKRKLEQKTLETKYSANTECKNGQKFNFLKNSLLGWLETSDKFKEDYTQLSSKRRKMRRDNYDLIMARNSDPSELEIDVDEPEPTLADAMKACETLIRFFKCQDNSKHALTLLYSMYEDLSKLELKPSADQPLIKDFFKKRL